MYCDNKQQELHNFHLLVTKLKWIRWAIHVELTEMRNAYRIILVIGKPKTSDLGDICIDGRIILKWTLKKQGVRV